MRIEITLRIWPVRPDVIPFLQEKGFHCLVTEDGTAVTTITSLLDASRFITALREANSRPPK